MSHEHFLWPPMDRTSTLHLTKTLHL